MQTSAKKPESWLVEPQELSTSFKRILVTTDFSAASRGAFQTALDFSKLFAANLSILHVFEYTAELPPREGEILTEMQDILQDAKDSLNALKREAAIAGVSCEVAIRTGLPSGTIEEFITTEHIDLTIMGTSALHGFERLVFGSTAEAVLRKSPTPVLTVGPRADVGVSRLERPVVFATDFHTTTIHAIRLAAAISEATHSPLHCVHVLPRSVQGGSYADVIPAILSEALHHVATTSGIVVAQPICATTYGSEVSNAVVDYARLHNAKLIVLGIRQASLMSTHTPAHIAYRIITEASCPVLTMAFHPPATHFSSLAAACI